jgi:hypothetical protein
MKKNIKIRASNVDVGDKILIGFNLEYVDSISDTSNDRIVIHTSDETSSHIYNPDDYVTIQIITMGNDFAEYV